jgi:hypothetical protein
MEQGIDASVARSGLPYWSFLITFRRTQVFTGAKFGMLALLGRGQPPPCGWAFDHEALNRHPL